MMGVGEDAARGGTGMGMMSEDRGYMLIADFQELLCYQFRSEENAEGTRKKYILLRSEPVISDNLLIFSGL